MIHDNIVGYYISFPEKKYYIYFISPTSDFIKQSIKKTNFNSQRRCYVFIDIKWIFMYDSYYILFEIS